MWRMLRMVPVLCAGAGVLSAQTIPFDSGRWEITADSSRTSTATTGCCTPVITTTYHAIIVISVPSDGLMGRTTASQGTQ